MNTFRCGQVHTTHLSFLFGEKGTYLSCKKLPHHYAKTENVCLVIIWFVFNHLQSKEPCEKMLGERSFDASNNAESIQKRKLCFTTYLRGHPPVCSSFCCHDSRLSLHSGNPKISNLNYLIYDNN